ncbi:response regulator transcription factor [Variovorax sp. YR752]|uniref:response regulator transcription factor n=1 Tax=Variovorax sp. YR752 TaxID=1884383 RepID=UPI003137C5FF
MMNHLSASSAHSAPALAGRYAALGCTFFGALIVEGDLALAERMRRLLCDLAPGRRVVIASTHVEAIHLLAALPYDLVLVDMHLSDDGGVALLSHLRRAYPQIDAIAMSKDDDRLMVEAAISSGASGYLLTSTDDAELSFLLRSIERGGSPIDARVARRVLGLIAASAKPEGVESALRDGDTVSPPMPAPGLLSPRELNVLRLIAQGWSNRQIAEAICLSINTVEFHAKRIYRKLAVKSRTQAVRQATQYGLLS